MGPGSPSRIVLAALALTAGVLRSAPAAHQPHQPMPLELRLVADRASAGGRLGLRITSRSEASHAVDPCTRLIEQYVAGAWGVVDEPKRVCDARALVLPPGTTRTTAVELPASLRAGRYRIMLQITRQGPPSTSRLRIISAPFLVEP